MLLRIFPVILATAMLLPPAAGKELSPEEDADLTRRFIASQRSLRTYRAEFEQSLSLLGLRNPSVSKGTFFYRAPDDVRIDYSQPAGDFFLLRGDQFHLAKNGNPPRSYPATDRSARVLVALRKIMAGRTEAGAGMVRTVRRDGGDYVVTLKLKTPSRDAPEKIENRIDAGTLALKRMTVTLPRGTRMEFSFSQPERNAKVDGKLFEQP